MKDLMDYSKKYGIGPADAMSRIRIHRQSTASCVALIHNSRAAEGLREDIEQHPEQEQAYYDDAISQDSSVISTDHEGAQSLNSSPRATSPTSSTASSKRLVHQADLVEPKRKKQTTNSEENSVPHAPTELVMDYVQPCNATLVEPNEYSSSNMKVSEDLDTSKNLVAAEADALINAKVLDQNEKKNGDKIESNGKYYYGFETDGAVDKSYYMDRGKSFPWHSRWICFNRNVNGE
ncbi:hypothetical protein K7X08_021592 [Anisodus acutangulus]|uniref:Uncharacterized protein n=1 Tax=Anisodus acutangulus TaxID=402998 RepID=A0A9Q1M9E9_9SOLA|nr:hypothetical protein K7X08_021592 [Anisodus acutangulus]